MSKRISSRQSTRHLLRLLGFLLPLILVMSFAPARAGQTAVAEANKPSKPKSSSAQSSKKKTQVTSKKKKRVRKSRRARAIPVPPSNGMKLGLRGTPDELALKSSAALVVDLDTGETLANKNADVVLPVASLTKLMTALVVVSSSQPLDEVLEIGKEDVDTAKYTHSRLTVGTKLTRDEMLLLALMSSENRAAMSLSRHYPGGRAAFISQMNLKAQELGMSSTHFADPAGLSAHSVSTARDLHRLMSATNAEPLIRGYSTQTEGVVRVNRRTLTFVNSNRLVRAGSNSDWDIELQKTGFTNEAGRCLVMQAKVLSRRLAMIFLDSTGTLTRYADAARVRKRVELELKTLQRSAEPVSTSATSS